MKTNSKPPSSKESLSGSGRQSSVPNGISAAIELPKGGGAIKGIEEKFRVNAVNGTSSFGIPLPLSPSRHGAIPPLELSYNSGSGNSPFGLGWDIAIPEICRKTEKSLPLYKDEEESDTFVFSEEEDLIPLMETQGENLVRYIRQRTENGISYTVKRYIPRIEGLFARIEKWENDQTGTAHWKTISKNNIHSYYGLTEESRISDPDNDQRIFKWLLCRTHDDKGNLTVYHYKKEDFANIPGLLSEKNRIHHCTQTYIKKVLYGNKTPYYLNDPVPPENDFLFKLIFDYGEHAFAIPVPKNIDQETVQWPCRKDPFSVYRSGFEVRTYRRCERVLMFHCFGPSELPHAPYLVNSLHFSFEDHLAVSNRETKIPGFSFLTKATRYGHKWDNTQNHYTSKNLPDLEFTYQEHEWNTDLRAVGEEAVTHAPQGIDDKQYLWVDLYNEGIAGILTEHEYGWYYKYNLGNGNFSPGQQVMQKPAVKGLTTGGTAIQETEGNGVKYLLSYEAEPKGFSRLDEDGEWSAFRTFASLPNINTFDLNARFIDLNGDGKADLLLTEENDLRWYESGGEKGFEVSHKIRKEIEEEKGPAILFNDQAQTIFLADMNGDGLTDIVRIRNGEVCYWPNMGYGHFGAKVSMDNSPLFDYEENFNPLYLRLADIDGSGTTDIIYAGKKEFKVWMNLNGNGFPAEPLDIPTVPGMDLHSNISVLDFLGTGTACVVCSTSLPRQSSQPLKYIDLMGSRKPGLMRSYKNNCGKEVTFEYRPSTYFYLEDKKEGKKWLTKLPFPVHCIYRVVSEDKVRETIYTSRFHYSHGYFDPFEREFRGFGKVIQWDTEEFSRFKINTARNVVEEKLHQPPVKTVSWFHTGAFGSHHRLMHQYREEYFQNPSFNEFIMPEPFFRDELTAEELREAVRACKGMPLRSEVYAEDDSPLAAFPYSVSESSYEIRRLQAKGENKFACFLAVPKESVNYNYERNPSDPRISHLMILETDELGNPLKKVSAIYPRAARPVAPAEINDTIWNEQNKSHIAYSERAFTNDLLEGDLYRLRAPFQEKLFEISGYPVHASAMISAADLLEKIAAAEELSYEQAFTSGIQKRLSGHSRDYYIKEDLSGALPAGVLSPLGIIYKKYQLAYTQGLLTESYGSKVNDAMMEEAGYVHLENDAHWWIHSGLNLYGPDPKNNFYTAFGFKNIFGNDTFTGYDAYTLLVTSITDALGNKVEAHNNYRTLSPFMVTDENLNRSAIETDELGLVIRSAVMGKEGSGDGDTMTDPTARMEYEVLNWQHNGKPNYVHTFLREKHGASNPRWQETYTYSDGSGSTVMVKNQAEPGKARRWNPVTQAVEEIDANPRWIGNGRTVYDNKGNVIKGYEPFFSTTHEYESEAQLVETGFTPVLYYDPAGRMIRTEFPDGTFNKIEFTAWNFKAFDVNDTVKDSQWYIDRGSPDPAGPEPADPDQRAAWLAARHHHTPSCFETDSMGRPFYSIADYGDKQTAVYTLADSLNRFSRSFDQLNREVSFGKVNMLGAGIYSNTPEKGENWILPNALGNIHRTWNNDVREFRVTYDQLLRPVSSFVKLNNEEFLFQHIVYGDILPDKKEKNLSGKAHRIYDQSGVSIVREADFKGNFLKLERRLAKEYKQIVNWASLKDLPSIADIDAAADLLLEEEVFTSSSVLDAMNRPVQVVLPDSSVVEPAYNQSNFLETFKVRIRGAGDPVTFMENQDYNAMGQREFVRYANGLITTYRYDARTFRLTDIITKKEGTGESQSHQNIHYTYDPIGNIVQCRDNAQQIFYFQNSVVNPESKFEYDALYQLTKASGRELAGLSNDQRSEKDLVPVSQLPHVNNADAVRTYIENYEYDDCSNLLRMQHIAMGGNWTRNYRYHYQDDPADRTNRLKSTSVPGDPEHGPHTDLYLHNLHGCMMKMPHLNELKWDFKDELKEADLGGGGKAYYCYGAGGGRVRKIIERQGGKKLERIYLGPVEIYREYQGSDKRLERGTLHVSDNTGKIAQIDTKTFDADNSDPANPLLANLIRYQFTNHLSSSTMETDENGTVISYEEYHPFGTSAYRSARSNTDLSLKRYRFSGKERDDETGFYYFGARYYAPWLGRWTSSDPANFADGLNLFLYCRNNPVMIKDPEGMEGNPKIVGASPSTEHLRDPSRQAEAQAYLERIYTGRLTDQTKRLVIDEMHFNSSSRTWIVDRWHLEDRGTGSSTAAGEPGGVAGGVQGGTPGGTPGSVPTPDAGVPPDADAGPNATGSPTGSATGTSGATGNAPGGAPGGVPGGSPNGSPGGSPQGSPQGTPGGSPTGRPGGSGSGGGGERSFWSRGGSVLLAGALLLAAGLFTILTAGAGTPLLILATGYMAAAGGAIMVTGGGALMAASYSGYTTAEEDREISQTLHDVGSLSSPFGLTGGAIGYAVNGREGMRTGALIGNVAHVGHGLYTFGAARLGQGTAIAISNDAKVVTGAGNIAPSAANTPGTAVLVSHGAPGMIENAAQSLVPLADIAPVVQSTSAGRVVVQACQVGQNPAAVQALANQTGRSITTFVEKVSNLSTNAGQILRSPGALGIPATPVTRAPQYVSPYLNPAPGTLAPAAAAGSEISRPR